MIKQFATIKDAIINNYRLFDYENKSLWSGRKIYLSYHEKTGWNVYALSFAGQILRMLNLAYCNTHSQKIFQKLEQLNLDEIQFFQSAQLETQMPKVAQKLKEVADQNFKEIRDVQAAMHHVDKKPTIETAKTTECDPSEDLFSKNLPPPQESFRKKRRQRLAKRSKEARKIILDNGELPKPSEKMTRASLKPAKVKRISSLDSDSWNGVFTPITPSGPLSPVVRQYCSDLPPPLATSPLYLKNYKHTRCYIDSVLEMMLSQNDIREKIFKECARKDLPSGKKEILEALRHLILVVHETKGQGKGRLSPEGAYSPGEMIREAIFSSKENQDLQDRKQIYTQQDAASIVLLINDLLNNSFQSVEIDTPIGYEETVSTIRSIRPPIDNYRLGLHFSENLDDGSILDLKELLKEQFRSKQAIDGSGNASQRNFLLPDEQSLSSPFSTEQKLSSLPDSLTLHVQRFSYMKTLQGEKLNHSLLLPQDGLIDMAPYMLEKKSEPHQYEITGYVIHEGMSIHGGHYTANVKIGDKFFACDDMDTHFHQEITAEEFYGNPNAYLIMLKKI